MKETYCIIKPFCPQRTFTGLHFCVAEPQVTTLEETARAHCWTFKASTLFDEYTTDLLIDDDIISSEVGLGLVYVIFATHSGGWG